MIAREVKKAFLEEVLNGRTHAEVCLFVDHLRNISIHRAKPDMRMSCRFVDKGYLLIVGLFSRPRKGPNWQFPAPSIVIFNMVSIIQL
jgi:hypothetical protein